MAEEEKNKEAASKGGEPSPRGEAGRPENSGREKKEEKEEKVEQEKEEKEEEVKLEEKPAEKPKEEPKVAEKAKKEIKVPAKFKKLVDEIEKMTVMDLAELVKILEEKFGVSSVVAAAAVPAAVGVPTEAAEEKTVFTVELKDAGSQKIQVIKVVRELIGKGLKEAKDLVDKAPQVVKENVKKEEAEEIKKKLEEAGATVELK